MEAFALPSKTFPVSKRLPVVTLVGRPNAGKSTLFNRLVGSRQAIVDEQPGVTRDRNVAVVNLDGREVLLVDTGGVDEQAQSDIARAVQEQTWLAAEEADVVVALFDGREGLNPLDADLVRRLRSLEKPVVYVVNKLDDPKLESNTAEFFALGIADPLPVSAEHGHGVAELIERVVGLLPSAMEEAQAPPDLESAVAVAIVGRPNVGKSSLLNAIAGYQRAIVNDQPGTTRDAIDTLVTRGDQCFLFIDTAGIRRRPRVREIIERASVVRAFRAIERAHVVLLLIDAVEGMTDQDARLAAQVLERGKALALVFNKWDLVAPAARKVSAYRERVASEYPAFASVPAAFISAVTGTGVDKLFPLVTALYRAARKQPPTARLNSCLQAATRARPAPSVRGKNVRFYYIAQTGIMPPTFTIFTSHPEHIPSSYTRYLENELREHFGWNGIPIRLRFRARSRKSLAHRMPAAR
jgi:GTP-binding protein